MMQLNLLQSIPTMRPSHKYTRPYHYIVPRADCGHKLEREKYGTGYGTVVSGDILGTLCYSCGAERDRALIGEGLLSCAYLTCQEAGLMYLTTWSGGRLCRVSINRVKVWSPFARRWVERITWSGLGAHYGLYGTALGVGMLARIRYRKHGKGRG